MPTSSLHLALLRPGIVQILRASGFHGASPAAIDVLTDITAKYLTLLAAQTASRAIENHSTTIPDVTDVRMAMVDCGLLLPTLTSTEEVWREILRSPLGEIPERNGLRNVQTSIRDQEDTGEIQEFISWVHGPVNKEIRRIAGLARDDAGHEVDTEAPDYLTGLLSPAVVYPDFANGRPLSALKTKHSKAGEESRFQGTVLGIVADAKSIKIDGGPETINDWLESMRQQKPTQNGHPPTRSFGSEDTMVEV
jgi:transcription initiation factor TFIID subunit 3